MSSETRRTIATLRRRKDCFWESQARITIRCPPAAEEKDLIITDLTNKTTTLTYLLCLALLSRSIMSRKSEKRQLHERRKKKKK